tara:strand:- start:383 stop:667 length:285 start_codon:yes stop_codon:yes gene_type:complete
MKEWSGPGMDLKSGKAKMRELFLITDLVGNTWTTQLRVSFVFWFLGILYFTSLKKKFTDMRPGSSKKEGGFGLKGVLLVTAGKLNFVYMQNVLG